MKRDHIYYLDSPIVPIYTEGSKVYITPYQMAFMFGLYYRTLLKYCQQNKQKHKYKTTYMYLFDFEDVWHMLNYYTREKNTKGKGRGKRRHGMTKDSLYLVKRLLQHWEQSEDLKDFLLECYHDHQLH